MMYPMTDVTIYRAYKMLLDPSTQQLAALHRHASDAKWAYNWTLRTMGKTDKFSYYKSQYLNQKADELGLGSMRDIVKSKRVAFVQEHNVEAKKYAKVKNDAFKARLSELLLNVLDWTPQQVKNVMQPSHFGLLAYWRQVRVQQMPWWNEEGVKVNPHAVSTAIKNAVEARKKFLSSAGAFGAPRFKKKWSSSSFTMFHNSKSPAIRPSVRHSRRLILPNIAPGMHPSREKKLGYLEGVRVQDGGALRKLRAAIKHGGIIKSVTISRSADRWYASCLVEETITLPHKPTPTQLHNGPVGVDLGVKILAALSDGSVIENSRHGRTAEKRKKALQRGMSSKVGARKGEKPSNRYLKKRVQFARLEHLTSLRRKTSTNQLSKRLAKDYGHVFVENLNVSGMVAKARPKEDPTQPGIYLTNGRAAKSGLAKSILDVGFYEFRRQLSYKTQWYSTSNVLLVPRFAPTSQTCSQCGYVCKGEEKLDLSVRTFNCPACGHQEDRDINAAKNIRNIGLTMISEV